MAKKPEMISIQEEANWGNLQEPRKHLAAIGARMIDNRRRNFDILWDRVTVVGRLDVAEKLKKWLFARKTLKEIAKNTRYVWGGNADEKELYPISLGKKYVVRLHVRCAGQYCYVAAYADAVEDMKDMRIGATKTGDDENVK